MTGTARPEAIPVNESYGQDNTNCALYVSGDGEWQCFAHAVRLTHVHLEYPASGVCPVSGKQVETVLVDPDEAIRAIDADDTLYGSIDHEINGIPWNCTIPDDFGIVKYEGSELPELPESLSSLLSLDDLNPFEQNRVLAIFEALQIPLNPWEMTDEGLQEEAQRVLQQRETLVTRMREIDQEFRFREQS
jgi:hypothetical protein